MNDATYFTRPTADWQRRYEALRAAFVERLPDRLIAERFGYSPGYISQLRFQFRHGKIDFSEPIAEGKTTSTAFGKYGSNIKQKEARLYKSKERPWQTN